jgi:hypothetical protein
MAAMLVLTVGVSGTPAGEYDMSWYEIGGTGESVGAGYELVATVGQPDAGVATMTLGNYELAGGFWPAFRAQESTCPADMNIDGVVDVLDLLDLLVAWGESGGDVDGNDTTDNADLNALLAAWGQCS